MSAEVTSSMETATPADVPAYQATDREHNRFVALWSLGVVVFVAFLAYVIDDITRFAQLGNGWDKPEKATMVSALVGGGLTAVLGIAGTYFAAVRATELGSRTALRIANQSEASQSELDQKQAVREANLARQQAVLAELLQQRGVLTDGFARHAERLFEMGAQMQDSALNVPFHAPGLPSGTLQSDLPELWKQTCRAMGLVQAVKTRVLDSTSLMDVFKALSQTADLIKDAIEGKHPLSQSVVTFAATGGDPSVLLHGIAARLYKSEEAQRAFLVAIEAHDVDEKRPETLVRMDETLASLHDFAAQRALDPAYRAAQNSAALVLDAASWLMDHAAEASVYVPSATRADQAPRLETSPVMPRHLRARVAAACSGWTIDSMEDEALGSTA